MKDDKTKKVARKDNRHEELENQLKRLEDELKRALADYRNLERRVEEERKLLGQLSSAILIEKLLPVLDNLETAQSHLADQGLEIVLKQFKDILSGEGVKEIQAEGSQFDPHLHEAIEVVEDTEPQGPEPSAEGQSRSTASSDEGGNEGRIVKVIAKGYKINDRVVRPAKVVVSRNAEPTQVEDQKNDQTDNNIEGGTNYSSSDPAQKRESREVLDQLEQ